MDGRHATRGKRSTVRIVSRIGVLQAVVIVARGRVSIVTYVRRTRFGLVGVVIDHRCVVLTRSATSRTNVDLIRVATRVLFEGFFTVVVKHNGDGKAINLVDDGHELAVPGKVGVIRIGARHPIMVFATRTRLVVTFIVR